MKLYICSAGIGLFILKTTDERGNFGMRSAGIRTCLVDYNSKVQILMTRVRSCVESERTPAEGPMLTWTNNPTLKDEITANR